MNGTQIRIAQIIELVESLKMKKIYPKIQPIFFSSYNRSNSLKNMNQQESFHDVNNGILVFTFSIIWKPICCSGFIFLFAVFCYLTSLSSHFYDACGLGDVIRVSSELTIEWVTIEWVTIEWKCRHESDSSGTDGTRPKVDFSSRTVFNEIHPSVRPSIDEKFVWSIIRMIGMNRLLNISLNPDPLGRPTEAWFDQYLINLERKWVNLFE